MIKCDGKILKSQCIAIKNLCNGALDCVDRSGHFVVFLCIPNLKIMFRLTNKYSLIHSDFNFFKKQNSYDQKKNDYSIACR